MPRPDDDTMYFLLLIMVVCIVGSGALSAWWIRKNPAELKPRHLNVLVGILIFVLLAPFPLLVAAISLWMLAA